MCMVVQAVPAFDGPRSQTRRVVGKISTSPGLNLRDLVVHILTDFSGWTRRPACEALAQDGSFMLDEQLDTHAGGFHSIHRRGEVSNGILALVSTICGGGSLSIPWAFAQSGLSAGLIILIASAWLSALGVHYLLCGARRAGGLRSFDSVLEAALGPWARIFTIWAVVITCFLTLIANSLLLRQLAAPLAAEFVLERALTRSEEVLLGSGLVCIVVPCTYLNTLHSLRHVSLMSVSSVVALVCVLAYKGFSCDMNGGSIHGGSTSQGAINFSTSGSTGQGAKPESGELGSLEGILRSLPVFVCIYICSFSALPLDIELRKPSRRRMTTMVVGAFAIAFALYLVAGLSGLAYGACTSQVVPSNVLAMFKRGDGLASLLRVLLSLVLLLSLPLICLPCRNMIQQSLVIWRRDASCLAPFRLALANISPALGQRLMASPEFRHGFDNSDSSEGEDDFSSVGRANGLPTNGASCTRVSEAHGIGLKVPTAPIGQQRNSSVGQVFESLVKEEAGEMPLATRIVLSSCIMLSALFCTANVDDVSVVWGFLGSTCGIMLSYVLPAASYLLLRRTPQSAEKKGPYGIRDTRKPSSVPRRKFAASLLVIIGLALIPTCLYNTARALWSTQS